MEAKLQKWGNSDGIRIPSTILKALNLKTNDKVNLTIEDEKIIISKLQNKSVSLEERFRNYKGENLVNDFSWDEAKGKELW